MHVIGLNIIVEPNDDGDAGGAGPSGADEGAVALPPLLGSSGGAASLDAASKQEELEGQNIVDEQLKRLLLETVLTFEDTQISLSVSRADARWDGKLRPVLRIVLDELTVKNNEVRSTPGISTDHLHCRRYRGKAVLWWAWLAEAAQSWLADSHLGCVAGAWGCAAPVAC